MKHLHVLGSILLGGVMALHGIAHLPAVLGSWGIATFEDVSVQPNVWLTDAGDGALFVLGAVWLLAAVSFVAAGFGAVRRLAWWPVMAALAIALSVPMTILWQEDAAIGLFLNAALIAILAGWFLAGSVREKMPVEGS